METEIDDKIPEDKAIEKPPEKPETPQQRSLAPVQAQKNGLLVGNTLEEQWRVANAYSKSGLMPKNLNSPEKVLVALQMCFELGLPPVTSLSKIGVINGSPMLYGNLPLALVKRSGLLESIDESWEYDKDGNVIKAKCVAKPKGMDPVPREFSMEDARKAGLFKNSVWAQYPKRMLQMRARGWALNDAFPDVLNGIAQEGYDEFVTEDDKTKTARELVQSYENT